MQYPGSGTASETGPEDPPGSLRIRNALQYRGNGRLGIIARFCMFRETYRPEQQTSVGENLMTGDGETQRTATFGAGCFWGVEAAFRRVRGVTGTAAGYMGGTIRNPSYEQVCTGQTGHAEVVQVTFDPSVVSYEDLLSLFWSIHDPTRLNRQGPDTGTNYRSVIFYHDPEQGRLARKSKEELQVSGRFGFGRIVTAIQPASEFWRAEEYHQQYSEKHGGHASCGI